MTQNSIQAALFRGGTTRGVFIEPSELPADHEDQDDLLLQIFGSPDPLKMQIDGPACGTSNTSKTFVVSEASESSIDLKYSHRHIHIDEPIVDRSLNGGNLGSAIGQFALDRGIISPNLESVDDDGRVKIKAKNAESGDILEQWVPISSMGDPLYSGDFKISGVPRSGPRITSTYLDPEGAITGSVFPTGNPTDSIRLSEDDEVEVSVIDIGFMVMILRAEDVGLTATETPSEINDNEEALRRIHRIRSLICEKIDLVDDPTAVTPDDPTFPIPVLIGEKQLYRTVGGSVVKEEDFDILARHLAPSGAHYAFSMMCALCTAASTLLPKTILYRMLEPTSDKRITIGHPRGIFSTEIGYENGEITYVSADRTARKIMDGEIYYPAENNS